MMNWQPLSDPSQYGGSPVVSGEDGKRALELAVEISSKIKSSST